MKKCPNCGREQPDSNIYCPCCGKKFAAADKGTLNEMSEAFDRTLKLQRAGKWEQAKVSCRKAIDLAEKCWARSKEPFYRTILTMEYETLASMNEYRDPNAAMECADALENLWLNEAGREADAARCSALRIAINVCLRHKVYADAKKYSEQYFALAEKRPDDIMEQLKLFGIRLELAELALEQGDDQGWCESFYAAEDQLEDLIPQMKSSDNQEKSAAADLQQKMWNDMQIRYARVCARHNVKYNHWDTAWKAYQDGWDRAAHYREQGYAVNEEVLLFVNDMAAFALNGLRDKIPAEQKKAGLIAAKTGLEWLEENPQNEQQLSNSMDIEQLRMDLTRGYVYLLADLKKWDDALRISEDIVNRSEQNQSDAVQLKKLLDAYVIRAAVLREIAAAKIFGKKEAVRQRNIAYQKVIDCAEKMYQLTGKSEYAAKARNYEGYCKL